MDYFEMARTSLRTWEGGIEFNVHQHYQSNPPPWSDLSPTPLSQLHTSLPSLVPCLMDQVGAYLIHQTCIQAPTPAFLLAMLTCQVSQCTLQHVCNSLGQHSLLCQHKFRIVPTNFYFKTKFKNLQILLIHTQKNQFWCIFSI